MTSLDKWLSRALRLSPDSLERAAYVWSRTRFVQEIEQVLHATGAWPGMVIQPDRFGLQFIAGNATLGNLRWDARLDVPFPADVGDRLVAEGMAACDPDESRADRVVWIVRTPADVDRAVWLLRLSYLRCCGNLEVHVASNPLSIGEIPYAQHE
jgi:luciferase-like monooxygenase